MSERPEGTVFQANFKTPAGTLLNIYASDGGEFTEMLDAFETFVPRIASLESLLGGASTVAQVVPLAPPAQQPVTAVPAAAPVAAGQHLCAHGEPAKLIPAGVSKASGKPYRAFYACARGRGDQCDFKLTA